MTNSSSASADQRLADIIKDLRVAMMITPGPEGLPHARPMYTLKDSGDDLYFFTDRDSAKVREISASHRVLLVYLDAEKNRYVCVQGSADVVDDSAKARELWNIHARAWWPQGPDDPAVALLRVRPERAEYWDGPSNTAYALGVAKALITGERVDIAQGEHARLTLP